ncbi:MAG: hypothetical protein ACRCXZ_02835 [Patescibacteria group bacterium]
MKERRNVKPRLGIVLIHPDNSLYANYNKHLIENNYSGLERFPKGILGLNGLFEVVVLVDIFNEYSEGEGLLFNRMGLEQTLPKTYIKTRSEINLTTVEGGNELRVLNEITCLKTKLTHSTPNEIDPLILQTENKISEILKILNLNKKIKSKKIIHIDLKGQYLSLTAQKMIKKNQKFPFDLVGAGEAVGSCFSYYSEKVNELLDQVVILKANDSIDKANNELHQILGIYPN